MIKTGKPKPNVREMAIRHGIEFPSDEELLMLILNGGCRNMPIEKLAEKALSVINECKPGELVDRLTQISGMGEAKALALAAASGSVPAVPCIPVCRSASASGKACR